MGGKILNSRGESAVGIIIVFVVAILITGGLYLYFYRQIPKASEITKNPVEKEFIRSKKPVEEKLIFSHGEIPYPERRVISSTNISIPTPVSASTPVPTSGLIRPDSITKKTEPLLAPTPRSTLPLEIFASPTPLKEKIPDSLGSIVVKGDENCISKTQEAIGLLQNKALNHYFIVSKYVSIIECAEAGSGMYAWEKPPRYQVGKSTYGAGTIWYAGTIVHDACHSKQYQDYAVSNPSRVVPDDVFTGKVAEAQCLDVQYDVLTKIGADQNTLNYVQNIINSEYWNIDYGNRWW